MRRNRFLRVGITGEVKREYVIDYTGRGDIGSARVIDSTDPAFAMSCIEGCARRRFQLTWGRPAALRAHQTIRFRNR